MAIRRAHHLNCGSMCPSAAFMGTGRAWNRGHIVCHCLLLETSDAGLVLIDTGFGTDDVLGHVPRTFRLLSRPALDPSETAIAQVTALGFAPHDVRHIVVTHLDLDHAGGLPDFPWARVHLHSAERHAALLRPSTIERQRYKPEHFAHGPRWQAYRDAGDDWFGFRAVRALEGIGEDVALVPLLGHTRGHSGIAVRTGDGWLLHAGDAYFHHAELDSAAASPIALRWFQAAVEVDKAARRANADRLRALHRDHRDEVAIICAHDPTYMPSEG